MSSKTLNTMRITIPLKREVIAAAKDVVLPKAFIPLITRTVVDDSPYQEVLRSLYDGVLMTDLNGKITYANVRAVDFMGYDRNDLYQFFIYNIISGTDELLMETITQNLESERFTYIEAYCVRNNGSVFPVEIAVNKLEDKGQLCFFVRDITKRKQAEEELHESVEKARELLNATPDLMFRINHDGTFLDFKAATQDQNEAPDQYLGKNIHQAFPEMSRFVWPHIEHAFQTGGSHQFEYNLEQDGITHYYEARIVPKGKEEVFTIVRDITDRKTVESELVQTKEELEKNYKDLVETQIEVITEQIVAVLDALAKNLNQEIANPIALLTGHFVTLSKHVRTIKRLLTHYEVVAELAREGSDTKRTEVLDRIDEMRRKEDLPRALDEVEQIFIESKKELKLLKEISEKFRTFAGDTNSKQQTSINQCIDAVLALFQSTLQSHCDVHRKFGEIPLLRVKAGELNQVIMNLLLNAADAISSKGEITIKTECDGENAYILITDTGIGMSPDKLSKIFDSWLTPQPSEKGKGLGLSICYSIIQKYKGTIDIQSEPGKGTTVTVRLPLAI